MNTEVTVFPYLVRFTLAYVVTLVILAYLMTLLGFDAGAGSSMAALFAACAIAAGRFVKDHERVPSPAERRSLTGLSLLASVAASALLVTLLLGLSGQLGQLPALLADLSPSLIGVVVTALLLGLAVQALILWFAYGVFARAQYRALQKHTA